MVLARWLGILQNGVIVQVANITLLKKNFYAEHFENNNPEMPKNFISELLIEKMSPFVQKTIHSIAESVTDPMIASEKFVFMGRPWTADFKTYQLLAKESE